MPEMSGQADDRINVLWLTKGLGPGGAERLLMSFAKLGDHKRFRFTAAYLLPWKDHLVKEIESCGVETVCLSGARVWDVRWAWRLRKLLADRGIDVIHVHSPVSSAFGRLVARTLPAKKRPTVVGTEHNVWSSHHWATRWANRLTLSLQDATIAVSEPVRDSMPAALARKTEVLVHGIDVESIVERRSERAAARAELGVDDDDLVVVTVANLRRNKDYPTLLQAARLLVARDDRVRFVSVGQGPLEAKLAALRDELGLGDRFRFLGYREDPVRSLVAGDLFCLSSRHEGLPIALLEAMAAGLPVVATSVGGIPAAVTDGVEGRMVRPGEPAELANAIAEQLDGKVRTRRGAAAAARASTFGIGRALEAQQLIYSEGRSRAELA